MGAIYCTCSFLRFNQRSSCKVLKIYISGIKDKNGKYLIPVPQWSKTVYAAGTKIHYYHEKDIDINTVYIPGPSTEKLTIVVSDVFRY